MTPPVENSQVAENALNKVLAIGSALHYIASGSDMPKRKPSVNLIMRKTDDDERLIQALKQKLGIAPSSIVRLALRKLAEIEGLQAA